MIWEWTYVQVYGVLRINSRKLYINRPIQKQYCNIKDLVYFTRTIPHNSKIDTL